MTTPDRRNDHADTVPVRLVIIFVGVTALLSLAIAAWLFWLGKSGEGVLAITNGCVMGLLALLGRTEGRQQPQLPMPVTGPNNGPVQTETVDEPAKETANE